MKYHAYISMKNNSNYSKRITQVDTDYPDATMYSKQDMLHFPELRVTYLHEHENTPDVKILFFDFGAQEALNTG